MSDYGLNQFKADIRLVRDGSAEAADGASELIWQEFAAMQEELEALQYLALGANRFRMQLREDAQTLDFSILMSGLERYENMPTLERTVDHEED
jgi:hypothetical protein